MIAIVGGGITGLYLAHLLHKQGKAFHLYEARDYFGGNIASVKEGPYLYETGPNSLRMNAHFHHLLEDLGLLDQVAYTNPKAKKRYVMREGSYHPMPMSPPSLLFGRFFRFGDLRRLWGERKRPAQELPEESVDAFFRRRFGPLVADYLVGPFISGIFAGDAKALRMASAFPQVKKWESEHGSVLKGFFKTRTKSEYKGIFSLQEGLGQLITQMTERLAPHLSTHQQLIGLERKGNGWQLEFSGTTVEADEVVLAMPAFATAQLLKELHPTLMADLQKVEYPAVSVVISAYKRAQVAHPLDGFGALNNQVEPAQTLGTIFSSSVFPGRCPTDEVLTTTFVGGSRHPERARLAEPDLLKAVLEDHQQWLGVKGKPVFTRVVRWEQAIPQYTATALAAQEGADALEEQGLFLGGNWTGGISVPACLEKAQSLCEQLT